MLIVDDDDVDRERVQRLLSRSTLDVQLTEAATSADALRLVHQHEFDCVMLDYHLGDANGADLLPALRREALRDCPIIMVTGAGTESLAVLALRSGAADYLTKFQLDTDVLVQAIRRAIERHQMQLEIAALQRQLRQRVEDQAAQIRERERDLQAILDHTPSVLGYWDRSLHNRFGNRAHLRWLGVDPQTLPGRHLSEVIGADRFDRHRERIAAVLAGQAQSFDEDLLATDGSTLRHVQLSLHPDVADDGEVRGFYSTETDVTPIRQAQARAEELAGFAEAVIDHAPVGCGVYEADGRCVMCNLALARAAEIEAAQWYERLLWPWLEVHARGLIGPARATLDDGAVRQAQTELLGERGNVMQIACTLARIVREGRPHLLLFVRDITEQIQAHQALISARDAAEGAARIKSAFLANMSHEIRTPMNAIVGLSRLALEDSLPPGARDYLHKVHDSALALMGLLDDVLDYSKMEAGRLRFEQLPFDLEQALQRVVDMFGVRMDQKGLEFVVDLSPRVPRRLVGDPMRLSQVLNNLVGNATKFTQSGHVHLVIRRLPSEGTERCLLRFAVRDSGVGIDPMHRDNLFEAFTQADGSITRRFGGTGLGLAISKRLVEMMDGRIGVDSELDSGSEFWFTASFPVVDDATSGHEALPQVAGLRVLLLCVPGSAAGSVIEAQLRAWQVRVTRAADLPGAVLEVEAARNGGAAFDAMVLDWQALGDHAAEGLARLRGRTGRLPIDVPSVPVLLMVTALGRDAAEHALTGDPPSAVLVKPVLGRPLFEALLRTCAQEVLSAVSTASGSTAQAERRATDATLQAEQLRRRAAPLAGARVLLVEDNELNQVVAQRFLERMGLQVTLASNGAEALLALGSSGPPPFDVVLMDMQMPVLDGLEATRRIRSHAEWAHLPVIGMTAAALPEDRARCDEAGMVDHVPKPVVPERLLDALLTWIPHSASGPAPTGRFDSR